MSSFWSTFIIVLVVGNILAMVWLLIATGRDNDIDQADTTGHKWDDIEELNNPLPRWWLGLFIITIIFSGFYLYLYPGLGSYQGSLGWSQTAQFEAARSDNEAKQANYFSAFADLDIESLASNQAAMATGARLFATNCSTCHGSDGRGAKGFPNLTDDDWLYGGDPEAIQTSIEKGRAGVMPNLNLPRTHVATLAHYVKYLAGGDASDFSVETGKQRFAICASCHGADGKGNQALGAPNLTDDVWLHGSSIVEIEEILMNGKIGNMPSFSSLLNDNEIKLLTAYVYSLNQQANTLSSNN